MVTFLGHFFGIAGIIVAIIVGILIYIRMRDKKNLEHSVFPNGYLYDPYPSVKGTIAQKIRRGDIPNVHRVAITRNRVSITVNTNMEAILKVGDIINDAFRITSDGSYSFPIDLP